MWCVLSHLLKEKLSGIVKCCLSIIVVVGGMWVDLFLRPFFVNGGEDYS